MPKLVLLDNDVVLKIACYSLVNEARATITIDGAPPAMLGVGRFVIRSKFDRATNIADVVRAKDAFNQFLGTVSLSEPSEDELVMAADLEANANRQDLELDGGESQLLAILANRQCRLLITGDKRAIVAMSVVAPGLTANRIGCLEQLIANLVQVEGLGVVRPHVCAEPQVDRAITICFSCSQASSNLESVLAGLTSYISDLGRSAPGVLLPGIDLASLTACNCPD